jgi:hypothetical protein
MEILQKNEEDEVSKFNEIIEHNKITLIMFVNEYSNYALTRKNLKYAGLD